MLECVGRRAIEHTAERDLKLHLFKQNNNEAFAGQGRADRTEAATSAIQFRKNKGVTHLPKKLRSSLKLAAREFEGGAVSSKPGAKQEERWQGRDFRRVRGSRHAPPFSRGYGRAQSAQLRLSVRQQRHQYAGEDKMMDDGERARFLTARTTGIVSIVSNVERKMAEKMEKKSAVEDRGSSKKTP